MFGKEQPDVVTDEDVGNYVNQLHQEGVAELNSFIKDESEEDDGVVSSSAGTSDGAEDKK